jgi:hypothetical protein
MILEITWKGHHLSQQTSDQLNFSFLPQLGLRTAKEPSEDGELAEADSTDGK